MVTCRILSKKYPEDGFQRDFLYHPKNIEVERYLLELTITKKITQLRCIWQSLAPRYSHIRKTTLLTL